MINKLMRVFGLGLMIATFVFAGFAQTPEEKTAVYNKYIENYQSNDVVKMQVALDAAKEYVAKFNKPEDAEQVKYFNDAIPTLEKSIADKKGGAAAADESKAWYAQLKKVVDSANAKNWAETFAQGKIAIDKQFQYADKPGGVTTNAVKGQKLDVAIALGAIGFDRAVEKNDTLNNDTLTYINSALQQLESGQTGTTTFGKAVGYSLDSKDNAIGLLNYYAGYILFYRQNKKDEALAYFYKATQGNSTAKNFPAVYENIGAKFYDKIAQMDPVRVKMVEDNKGETDETKAMLAEERGNAERGIEAYSKALKAAQADAKVSQKYKDDLRATLEQLYKFRMNLKEGEKVEGLDAYINTAAAKPLTNPAEPVKPIVVEEPAPTETTPASTTSTAPATTPATTPATKPAATTPATKPAATTATKPAAGSTTKPAATATKPAPTTTTTTKTTTPKKPRRR